jgi:hypothetical protein
MVHNIEASISKPKVRPRRSATWFSCYGCSCPESKSETATDWNLSLSSCFYVMAVRSCLCSDSFEKSWVKFWKRLPQMRCIANARAALASHPGPGMRRNLIDEYRTGRESQVAKHHNCRKSPLRSQCTLYRMWLYHFPVSLVPLEFLQ